MTTKKIVTYIIIALLVANLGLLTFFICTPSQNNKTKSHTSNYKSPKEIITNRLALDESQSIKFSELITIHRQEIIESDEQILNNKKELYSLLAAASPDEKKADSIATVIGALQKEIEFLHFKHFQRVKGICKEDQIEKFNDLSKDITNIFHSKKRGRKHKNN